MEASQAFNITIPWAWVYGIVGSIIVSALGAICFSTWRWVRPWIIATWDALRRLKRAESAVSSSSKGIWLAQSIPIQPPVDFGRALKISKPIIVVANLKGGVGKTTTVANLIGYFAIRHNKRVLAIDLDFQGSLSETILTQEDYAESLNLQNDSNPSKASMLVDGRNSDWLLTSTAAVDGIATARCIPSYYSLAATENRVMVEWLVAKRSDDIRFTLARLLHDPKVQDRFDIILIDAPPRLTTGCIQALAAATHVLLPTVLDDLSAVGTGGFVGQLVTNQSLWPHLSLLGAFGNMTARSTVDANGHVRDDALADYEADAVTSTRDAICAALDEAGSALRASQAAPMLPIECFIPNKAEISRKAGKAVLYGSATGGSTAVQDIRRAYDRLGDEILRRIDDKKR